MNEGLSAISGQRSGREALPPFQGGFWTKLLSAIGKEVFLLGGFPSFKDASLLTADPERVRSTRADGYSSRVHTCTSARLKVCRCDAVQIEVKTLDGGKGFRNRLKKQRCSRLPTETDCSLPCL